MNKIRYKIKFNLHTKTIYKMKKEKNLKLNRYKNYQSNLMKATKMYN